MANPLKVRQYCRYVDDFILFDLSREQAVSHKAAIEEFIARELGMTYSKWTIAPVRRGVNFVGYRTWRGRRFIRKHSMIKFNRAIRRANWPAAISILAHARRTSSCARMQGAIKQRRQEREVAIVPSVAISEPCHRFASVYGPHTLAAARLSSPAPAS